MKKGCKVRALLDVNVLIALLDQGHIHHQLARNWLVAHASSGWASCPLTLNGCIRIMAQPSYPGSTSVMQMAQRLQQACQHPAHEFWPDDVNPLAGIDFERLLGHRQLTDAYLLALAVHHGGRLVTFDTRIALAAVPNAQGSHLHLLLS